MKLKKLRRIINRAYQNAKGIDVDVEILLYPSRKKRKRGKKDGELEGPVEFLKIAEIGQFGIVPDVTISVIKEE